MFCMWASNINSHFGTFWQHCASATRQTSSTLWLFGVHGWHLGYSNTSWCCGIGSQTSGHHWSTQPIVCRPVLKLYKTQISLAISHFRAPLRVQGEPELFCPERKHRAVKSIANHCFNDTLNYHVTLRMGNEVVNSFSSEEVEPRHPGNSGAAALYSNKHLLSCRFAPWAACLWPGTASASRAAYQKNKSNETTSLPLPKCPPAWGGMSSGPVFCLKFSRWSGLVHPVRTCYLMASIHQHPQGDNWTPPCHNSASSVAPPAQRTS